MSFVNVANGALGNAAINLASVGTTLSAANAAAALRTTAVLASAQDQVSAAVAAMFSGYGQGYQTFGAQAEAFHRQIAQALTRNDNSYANAEAANAAATQSATSGQTPHEPNGPAYPAPRRQALGSTGASGPSGASSGTADGSLAGPPQAGGGAGGMLIGTRGAGIGIPTRGTGGAGGLLGSLGPRGLGRPDGRSLEVLLPSDSAGNRQRDGSAHLGGNVILVAPHAALDANESSTPNTPLTADRSGGSGGWSNTDDIGTGGRARPRYTFGIDRSTDAVSLGTGGAGGTAGLIGFGGAEGLGGSGGFAASGVSGTVPGTEVGTVNGGASGFTHGTRVFCGCRSAAPMFDVAFSS